MKCPKCLIDTITEDSATDQCRCIQCGNIFDKNFVKETGIFRELHNNYIKMQESMRDDKEGSHKHIKVISHPTGWCFWENRHLRENNQTGVNEIDTYISEVNSQDNFIAEINSLPMPETYPHEDDRFYIPEEYKNMSSEQLKNVKKAWDDYYKDREKMRESLFREGATTMNKKEIKIKYFTNEIEKLRYIDGKSDWIDLRSAADIELKAGEFKLIPLGIAMQLPKGYEAHIVPRSSTFKNFGIIQTNHMAVIDESYCGDNDQWFYPVYAMRDTTIKVNDRICQFRIMEHQPVINFTEVMVLNNEDRGGHGSTGKQ